MSSRRVAVSVAFYLGVAAVWVSIWLDVLPSILPAEVATRIGYNSEGFVLALLLAAWIQFVRPRVTASRGGSVVAIAVAVVFLLLGLVLLNTDLPSKLKTQNETFIGFSLLICYVQLGRPLPRWLAPALSALVLALLGLSIATDVEINLAETVMMCLLAPLIFDVFDKGILDPRAHTSTAWRYAWYAVLILVPITFSALWHAEVFDPGTLAYRINNYEVRTQEAFVGMLLVALFFAVGLGRTGRPAGVGDEPA